MLRSKAAEGIWRPTACQFIAGDPRADETCKCGRPVWRAGAAFCAEHDKLVYVRERHQRDGSPEPEGHDGVEAQVGLEPVVAE